MNTAAEIIAEKRDGGRRKEGEREEGREREKEK